MRPGFDEPDKRDGKRHKGDTVSVLDHAVVSDRKLRLAAREPVPWTRSYLRWAALTDAGCGLLGGGLALYVRFAGQGSLPVSYVAFAVALPPLWCASVALAGGYGSRIIGAGSDEFRRVLNAAVGLAAGVAIVSYVFKIDFARGYFVIALPSAAALDLAARYRLRKRLHRLRSLGSCMQRVVAVGHAPAVADLVATLRGGKHKSPGAGGARPGGGAILARIEGGAHFVRAGRAAAAARP